MTKVKICGLFRPEDIEIVNSLVDSGLHPDYIGFVFAESRRRVTPEVASRLRAGLSPEIAAVGVFVNEPIENIAALVADGVIDAVQLHGNEDCTYIRELKSLTSVPIIDTSGSPLADYHLFDSPNPGSGVAFDWSEIPESGKPFFLAGGLNPDNIGDAIRLVSPFAADVSSGVEVGGVKDAQKIRKFMQIAKFTP
jgi:phosphoribosylanthranilate isomerase